MYKILYSTTFGKHGVTWDLFFFSQMACKKVEESERLVEKLLADVSDLRRMVNDRKQELGESITFVSIDESVLIYSLVCIKHFIYICVSSLSRWSLHPSTAPGECAAL